MIKTLNINDWESPMSPDKDPIMGLRNPYSTISCIIIKFYTMEFGMTPLYVEVNRALRDQDYTLLREIGPYIKCLSEVTSYGEINKNLQDQ